MRYVKLFSDADGRSHFEDAETVAEPRLIVQGVPPLLLSGPFPVNALLFVQQPQGCTGLGAACGAARQWVILLSGRSAVTASDGERREFAPGDVLLLEDTEGEGHLSVPLTEDLTFAMIPTA